MRLDVPILITAMLIGSILLQAPLAFAQVRDDAGDIVPGVVYYGPKSTMTFKDFAAYSAPAIWFSPDEPLLMIQDDGYFQLPLPLPFEEPTDSAVVYYRLSRIIGTGGSEVKNFWTTAPHKDDWVINLEHCSQVILHFFFYYDRETGVGAHPHDFETVEFSINILHDEDNYGLQIRQVIAHAHGVPWYFNVLDVMKALDVTFPTTILVEEGKHGNCTDRNGDGFYSPGYDVNKRVNDAWGVRDIKGAGYMITPYYQTWMTKDRSVPSRIAPPLPKDSPWYDWSTQHYSFAEPNKRQYTLRPVPDITGVDFSKINHGNLLKSFIESKEYPDWPEGDHQSALETVEHELFDESFLGSWGYGYRYDDESSLTITFPLLLVRNFELPAVGGWLVNRVYMNLGLLTSDFKLAGYQLTYTPSASRWVDWYVGAGFETRDLGSDNKRTSFAYETGSKFRLNILNTPLKFLHYLGSDFWGFRVGIQAVGFARIDEWGFVLEVGAGVW